jgi:hypothetical protein
MSFSRWLVEQVKTHGRGYAGGDRALAADLVQESVKEKKFNSRLDFDNRQAAEAAFGIGWGLQLDRICKMNASGRLVAESIDGTDPSAFISTLSSIYTAEVQRGYDLAKSSVDDLFFQYPTPDRLGEITVNMELMPTEKAREVAPGQPYPQTDFNGYNVTIPKPVKGGLIAYVLLEHMTEGQTADRLDAAFRVGEQVALQEKEDKLSVLLGITNPYRQNGSALTTYLTSGSWVNALDDFNQVNGPEEFDRAERLFDAMVDPITGQIINVGENVNIYVPRSNLIRTRKNVSATELWTESGATPNLTVVSSNPVQGLTAPNADRMARKLLIDSGVSSAITDTYVIYGDFQRAFGYRIVRPFEVMEMDTEMASEVGFRQDIIYACKARKWAKAFVRNPRYVVRLRKTA